MLALLVGAYLGRDTVERWTGVEVPELTEVSRVAGSIRSSLSSDAEPPGPGGAAPAERPGPGAGGAAVDSAGSAPEEDGAPGAEAPPAEPAAPAPEERAGGMGVGGPPVDSAGSVPSEALLGRRLDSLSVSLDRYRERRRDFVRGRLGCRGLARGFREVEERLDVASRVAGETGAGAETGTAPARYRRLSAAADSADRFFAASGCGEEE